MADKCEIVDLCDSDDEDNLIKDECIHDVVQVKEPGDINGNEQQPCSSSSSPSSSDAYGNGEAILNLLLTNPEEIDLGKKPSALRHSTAFTLNRKKVSIESAKADDNGAYESSTSQKYFIFDDIKKKASMVHYNKSENNFYMNCRVGREYEKSTIDDDNLYMLTRTYRINKNNPGFMQIIATVTKVKANDINDY